MNRLTRLRLFFICAAILAMGCKSTSSGDQNTASGGEAVSHITAGEGAGESDSVSLVGKSNSKNISLSGQITGSSTFRLVDKFQIAVKETGQKSISDWQGYYKVLVTVTKPTSVTVCFSRNLYPEECHPVHVAPSTPAHFNLQLKEMGTPADDTNNPRVAACAGDVVLCPDSCAGTTIPVAGRACGQSLDVLKKCQHAVGVCDSSQIGKLPKCVNDMVTCYDACTDTSFTIKGANACETIFSQLPNGSECHRTSAVCQ